MTTTFDSLAALNDLRSILVIPFEDLELVDILRKNHPEARLHVLSKEDMIGGRMLRSVSALRRNRYDLACASLHGALVHRSPSSVRFLLSLFRAQRYVLRTTPEEIQTNSFFMLAFQTYPRLFIGSLLGLTFVLLSYGYLLLGRRAREKKSVPQPASHDILFLRTDLAGAIQSGGSVSHVKGIIGAFLKRGFRVTYVADERCKALPAEVRQIPIAPLSILGFFDEFQLLAFNFQLWYHRNRIAGNGSPILLYQRHSAFGFSMRHLSRSLGSNSVLEVNASEVWVKQHWSRLIFRHLARLSESFSVLESDVVSVISNGVREQLSKEGLHPRMMVTNPNGVDPDEFHPAVSGKAVRRTLGFSPTQIVVGFIGTFAKWHGVETLIEAAIRTARKKSALRFLFIGDGGLRSLLEQRVLEAGYGKAIVFAGLVPHSSAPPHLAACDILVSPHLGFDDATTFFGSPTKLFEYMAMGKAIVASNLEQIGDVIRDGINGVLVKPGDADGLAGAILRLAHDSRLRRRLGRQARLDVMRNHTWDHNVRRTLDALKESQGS